jgi:hypothetical protein
MSKCILETIVGPYKFKQYADGLVTADHERGGTQCCTEMEKCLLQEVQQLRGDSKNKSKIIEKERVVQRKIHEVFRHLESQVSLGWKTCLKSFGERDEKDCPHLGNCDDPCGGGICRASDRGNGFSPAIEKAHAETHAVAQELKATLNADMGWR